MARRKTEVFSMSFLDVIACGFGAIVLFYTIIAAQAGVQRQENNDRMKAMTGGASPLGGGASGARPPGR